MQKVVRSELTLAQHSLEYELIEFKVDSHGIGRRVTDERLLLPHTSSSSCPSELAAETIHTWPRAPLRRPLEISLLTKLRALCLHSRYINPLIPHRSTRSLHVSAPTARTTTANTTNMNWSSSVYTALTSDTEPSIVITFDSAKYIFNAGENTTRAILQSKKGWKKVKALFLTQLGTQRSSGVPGVSLVFLMRSLTDGPLTVVLAIGLLMSVADSSPRTMQIVGPSGLLHYLASMRFHVFRFVRRISPHARR
jgi:hypothetical protein